ncbi:uncharacterized protein LOC108678320 isoform X2 [Hyalella azteca]|uniref:Uncharacterized protein LOC108678320 isoform X2 n=1 Tax=Hyalella azteca TaxID=294128 RepID=A0A8B7P7P5_HYAAZ|nr:uncharacterized protein LOC108678320 isoform X2 [Hyalella azteca]
MQLIFHSDPEGRDGGFHITVYQMQCGNFEPIGTFSGLHTATGPQIFTSPPQHGTSWTHPKQGGNGGIFAGGNIGDVGIHYVDPAPSRNSSQIGSDKQFINTSFGTSDTSVHYNGHEYDNYPEFVTDHKHHPQPQGHFDKDYHYVYYYLPQPTPQVVEVEGENKLPPSNQNQGKEKYDFFAMMKSKFKKMKDIFRKDYKKTRESGDAQVDVHYEKPEPRPQPQRKYRPTTTTTTYKPRPTRPLKITSQNVGYEGSNYQHRPYRYIFIRNPYYRPPEPGSYVRPTRFRYPQVYPQTQRPTTYVPTTQRPYTQTPYTQRPWSSQGARYPQHNAYIVVPSHQAHHVPQTGYLSVSPARPGFRPFWSTSGSSSYATTPVYTDSSITPDYVITPTPIHPPTEQINQRPINFPPVHTTPRAISFPDIHVSPSSNVAGLATVRPFRPPTVLITATPPPFFGPTNSISSPRHNKAIPALIIPSSSSTSDHFEDFTDNFSGFSDISQLPLASESLVNTVTVSGCGRRIMEEEFHIDSSEALHHVSSKGPQLCTYHIAKSGADRCSLVLQVQDLQFNENCRNSSDARCSDEPSVHMLTSFAGNGDLSLQFNASSAETTTFTLYGRQIACGEKITPTEVENGRTTVHNWEVVATASPGSRGWGSIKTKWVGPQGRGRETRTIIKQGGEGVSVLKPAVERW